MTVREYFESWRDGRGRAVLSESCWIDQWAGSYRLNGPIGTVLVTPDENVEIASGRLNDLNPEATKRPFVKPVRPRFGRKLESGKPFSGDEFDNQRGVGAWPGLGFDDAQPEDFEDTAGDSEENLTADDPLLDD